MTSCLLAAALFISPAETNAAGSVAYFERDLVVDKAIVRATWAVTGQGVFEACANGVRVGDDFLKPGFVSAEKARHVYTYDVTDLLKRTAGATNRLSATVAPTWWCDAMMDAHLAHRPGGAKRPWKLGERVAFRGTLTLTCADGSQRLIETDESWCAAYTGPVKEADLYHGEVYDARTKPAGLRAAVRNDEFTGVLRPAAARIALRRDLTMLPCAAWVVNGVEGADGTNAFGRARVVRRYGADDAMRLAPGEMLVLDFGQNASAVPDFTVEGPAGAALHLRPSEMLNDANGERARGNDGPAGTPYRAALRAARAEMRYTLCAGRQRYMPRYTFFGYRYVGVETTAPVVFTSFASVPVSSVTAAMEHGRLVTGHARVNRLVSNVRWGMLSNYLSIPTDCPQRDERLGWTADTQVFMNTGLYLADVGGFLEKYLQDLRDAQYANGLYACFVPHVRHVFPPWASCGWTDAGVLIPYRLWKWYGDARVIETSWESMERYMAFLRSDARPYRLDHCDWLAYEHRDRAKDPGFKYIMNAYFHPWMARLMAEMARATGRADRAAAYAAEAAERLEAFRQRYLDESGCLKGPWRGQCHDLYALKLGLCRGAAAEEATRRDLIDNIHAQGNRLQTGFLGTAVLLPVLTFEAKAPDVAYDLLLQDREPSWLYSVDQGATTVWERWNSYTKAKGFGAVSMNSFNHYAYGCVVEWLYAAAAGIRQEAGSVGWEKPLLAPCPDPRLGFLTASTRTPRGTFRSAWSYREDGSCVWTVEIPAGVTATVVPPGAAPRPVTGGRHVYTCIPH